MIGRRLLTAAVALTLSAGCAGDVCEDFCDKAATCEPEAAGSAELANCATECNAILERQDKLGCGSEFEDYMGCFVGLDGCEMNQTIVMSECADEVGDFFGCYMGKCSTDRENPDCNMGGF